MRIQHNIMAMNAYRNYNTNTSALSKNLEKLSSGYKINRAGDDAAGLAISEKMRAQITGLNAAQKNVKDGISLVKTAEGAMQEIQDMLNRMDYLATQSANGTYDNDVDRKNLQKEVDALKSEINRIADSSNFNGIKLLDGKAGINTSAFTKFENVDGVVGHDGTVPVTNWTGFHEEQAAASQQNASALIDLGGLNFTAAAAGDTVSAQFEIGGATYTATMTGKTAYTATDVATALKDAIVKSGSGVDKTTGTTHTAGSSSNDALKIGGNVYEVTLDGSNVKLTLAGVGAGATYKQVATTPNAATNDFNDNTATQINNDLGMDVKLGTVTGSTGQSGTVVHKTTDVHQAVAHKDESLAGIDLTLTEAMVKNGATIEIDGKKFYFHTEGTDPAVTNATKIDLSDAAAKGLTGDKLLHYAADKLSETGKTAFAGKDDRQWKIGSAGGAKIHFEQTVKSASGKELKTQADLTSKIKINAPATADKGAGVAITVDPTKVAVGNTLRFGEGDDMVTLKVVESGADSSKGEINKASITGTIDAAAISSALGGKYEVSVADGTGDDADKKVITVRSKTGTTADTAAVANSKAPVVTGTGLQLQIGDTSDSYNRLAVEIGDMHTAALGIASLDISNPEGAAAAIQTVRDAINQVSSVRGDLGAIQNRLEHTANNLSVMAENIQDAESTIRDTDVAEEMMAYTKNNILVQSAQAMLAQANAVPQGVLQLLG